MNAQRSDDLAQTSHAARPAAVPRQWIGAQDSSWNPTLTLMLLVITLFAAMVTGHLQAKLPLWLVILGLAVSYYLVFTVLHESMHGIAHRNRRLNAALGRVGGFALMLPLPLFRAAHLAHHSHTNEPGSDPDLMVAHRPAWLRPLWFLLTPLYYRVVVYGGGLLRTRGSRAEAYATEAAIVGVMVGAVLAGQGAMLLQLWVLPSVLAILWLALAFDLLPLHPHVSQERYYDTRVYPGRALNWLLLGQNYHLVHHLWTTIPWYRYERAFRDVESDLIERGAPIGWSSRAEPPRG